MVLLALDKKVSTSYFIALGFGFPVLTSQLLSAPPNVLQLMSILLGGYLTDRYKNKRGLVITIGFSIAALGFLLLGLLENRWGKQKRQFFFFLTHQLFCS